MSRRLSLSSLPLLSLVLVAACSGDPGEKGDTGTPGTPATGNEPQARFVVPNKGVLDRELDIVVSGSATKFDQSTTVELGEGITVVSKTVISPTSLGVKIKIEKTAALGPRDIKVGGLTAAKAFEVKAGISVKATGSAQQGGLGIVEVENLDDRAFDANAFQITATGLLPFGAQTTGPFGAQGLVLVPPLTAAGKLQISADNLDSEGKPRLSFFSAPGVLDVVARGSTAVAIGAPKNNESFANAAESKLYKVSTPANANAIVSLTMHVNDGQLTALSTVLWGAGGKAEDLLARHEAVEQTIFGPFPKEAPYDLVITFPVVSGAAKDYFLTALDLSGESNTKFNLVPTQVTATLVDEAAGVHDAQASAQDLAVAPVGAGILLRGEITDTKLDWYKFTVAAGEKIEIGLDTPGAGQAGVNDGTEFLIVTEAGKQLFGNGAVTGALTAGEHFIAVAGDKGKYTLAVKRIAP